MRSIGTRLAVAVTMFGLALGATPAMAQYYYACPPGTYYAQGYGCVAAAPPPPPVYYYAPSPPPPVVYPGPFIGLGFGFGFGDHDWHGGGDWHHH